MYASIFACISMQYQFPPVSDELKYSGDLSYPYSTASQVERDRLERKRERNRVAANKCR